MEMINPSLFLPLALGVTVVLQASLNRSMGNQMGLSLAVLINAAVFLVLSLGFFLLAKYTPMIVPEFWRFRPSSQAFSWYYLVPGFCGFFLVMGLPWSIQQLGPSTSFLILIASQILISFFMEAIQQGHGLDLKKSLGVLFVLIGAALTIL